MASKKSKKRVARISDRKLADTLFANGGLQARAGRALGMSRQAVYYRVKRTPALEQAIIDGRETLLDDAEEALKDLIDERNVPCVLFALKTLGKSRGYVETTQHEHSGAGGKPIQIELASLRAAMLHEDEYLDYQRQRASEADSDAGALCADGESRSLEAGEASANPGSEISATGDGAD